MYFVDCKEVDGLKMYAVCHLAQIDHGDKVVDSSYLPSEKGMQVIADFYNSLFDFTILLMSNNKEDSCL